MGIQVTDSNVVCGLQPVEMEKPHTPLGEGGYLQEGVIFLAPERWEAFAKEVGLLPDPEPWQGGLPTKHPVLRRVPYAVSLPRLLVGQVEVVLEKSGTWTGYGHGRATVTVTVDGVRVYEESEVAYCQGPGYRCSYAHGPFFWHQCEGQTTRTVLT